MSDPIADMLTRIRNAVMIKRDQLSMPASGLKAEIAALLRHEGYISGFKIIRKKPQDTLMIQLKYRDGASAIRGIKRISKPGLRVYTDVKDVPKVLNGIGAAFISTNKGLMTDVEARENNVGGEVLCYVW